MNLKPFGVVFLVLLISSTSAVCQRSKAGIYQLIERSSGRAACWGFVVQLRELTFADSLSVRQISIVDAKHNRDLTDMMDVVLDRRHKVLTLRFKLGKDGFGSGNSIEVTIDGSAFTDSPRQKFTWSIPTDPL